MNKKVTRKMSGNNENAKAIRVIINGVKNFIENAIKRADFAGLTTCKVVGVLGGGKYIVSIMGAEHNVSCCTGQTFVVRDSVLVLFTQNMKYIIGRA